MSAALQLNGDAQTQEKPVVQIPKAGQPQVLTMEAKFVRAAYNNEGYVILGYQASNRSIGEDHSQQRGNRRRIGEQGTRPLHVRSNERDGLMHY
jgi:hypothetical protein